MEKREMTHEDRVEWLDRLDEATTEGQVVVVFQEVRKRFLEGPEFHNFGESYARTMLRLGKKP